MARILADLPDEDIAWLDAKAIDEGRSRAAVMREAVSSYRARSLIDQGMDWLDAGFGAWKDRTDTGDAVEWQRRERASWTRPWDADYPEIRAEFPDLFDDEDDREHAFHKAWMAKHGMKLGEGYPTLRAALAEDRSDVAEPDKRAAK